MKESALLWAIVLWMAAVGGAVGSFLNVVVYRLPAGLSLSHPGSHCPKCKHPIRWYDNVPVLGWLMLGGRCRDCRTWIPIRYPAVEAFVAGLFALILLAEGATFGANLPGRPAPVVDGLIVPSLTTTELAGIMGWHLLLLCTILCAALIRYDGHHVPEKLFYPLLAVGAVGSVLWPHLHPQPAAILPSGPTPGAVDAGVGLLAGAALGLLAWRMAGPAERPTLAWAAGSLGMFLGWQAALVIVPLAIVCSGLSKLAGPLSATWRRIPPVGWLGLGAVVWIVQWKQIAGLLFASAPF